MPREGRRQGCRLQPRRRSPGRSHGRSPGSRRARRRRLRERLPRREGHTCSSGPSASGCNRSLPQQSRSRPMSASRACVESLPSG
ncbi:MAG: hypothetical protein E6J77_28430 [Deltaproteobacteria bacterium]|nr:MAG: hypothetical protein E6J77_28430 [Deltaproteobacteria bacterium]